MIGCGRVGSPSQGSSRDGWDVPSIDEKEEALTRLGDDWTGGFLVGHGMDVELLRAAGIEDADAVVVATDGDNTNIVDRPGRAEALRHRCVIVRILDPARAEFYARAGLRTVCPTSSAIGVLTEAVRACESAIGGAA